MLIITGDMLFGFISSHFPAGVAAVEIFSQSSSKSEGVEVEWRPGSITELSPEHRQIEKPVQHLKVDHLYPRNSD